MTGAQWSDLIKTLGLPLALCVAALMAGARERPLWVFGTQHREMVERLNADIASLRTENEAIKKQYREDLAKERDLSNALLGVNERVAQAVEKVAGVST